MKWIGFSSGSNYVKVVFGAIRCIETLFECKRVIFAIFLVSLNPEDYSICSMCLKRHIGKWKCALEVIQKYDALI